MRTALPVLLVVVLLGLAGPARGGDAKPEDPRAPRSADEIRHEIRALAERMRELQSEMAAVAAEARAVDQALGPDGRHPVRADLAQREAALASARQRLAKHLVDLRQAEEARPAAPDVPEHPVAIARLAAALRESQARNQRLETRVAALEQRVREAVGSPHKTRGRRLESRLDRLERKLDRLLEATGAGGPHRKAAPDSTARRSFVWAPLPPVEAARPHPGSGATMAEIEKLLDRARERIRDLERSLSPPTRNR